MKRVLLTIFLMAVVCATAWAELTIPELKLRKKGADINVRVVLRNPDRATVRGPDVHISADTCELQSGAQGSNFREFKTRREDLIPGCQEPAR